MAQKKRTAPVVEKDDAEDVLVGLGRRGDLAHRDRLADHAAQLEFVVELPAGPELDGVRVRSIAAAAVLAQGTADGGAGGDDRGAAAAVAEGKVREPGGQDAFAEDGLAGVDDVVFGAREVGEVADVDGHVHLRFSEAGHGAWRGRVGGAWRKGVLDGGADGAAGGATEGGEVVQGGLTLLC